MSVEKRHWGNQQRRLFCQDQFGRDRGKRGGRKCVGLNTSVTIYVNAPCLGRGGIAHRCRIWVCRNTAPTVRANIVLIDKQARAFHRQNCQQKADQKCPKWTHLLLLVVLFEFLQVFLRFYHVHPSSQKPSLYPLVTLKPDKIMLVIEKNTH